MTSLKYKVCYHKCVLDDGGQSLNQHTLTRFLSISFCFLCGSIQAFFSSCFCLLPINSYTLRSAFVISFNLLNLQMSSLQEGIHRNFMRTKSAHFSRESQQQGCILTHPTHSKPLPIPVPRILYQF